MRVNTRKIMQKLEMQFPLRLAEKWDNVGLQIGNENHVIERILICLEVTEVVINEAIAKGIDLIIAHHPLIFKPPTSLSENNPKARLMTRLIRENIALYVMHTNLDMANGGLNDFLSQRMNLKRVQPFCATYNDQLFKLGLYVPQDAVSSVSAALFAAGAGQMGQYVNCGFEIEGRGSFTPLEGSNPTIGQVGHLTTVPETKIETIVGEQQLSAVIKALKAAHPYEMPAYDIFKLEAAAETYHIGRVGYLEKPLNLHDFISHIKNVFSVDRVKVSGLGDDYNKTIGKVALVSGAGMDYVQMAAATGADVFITGDIRYHEAQEQAHLGMILVDVGHFESEVVYKHYIKDMLDALITDQSYDLAVFVSEDERPVFKYL